MPLDSNAPGNHYLNTSPNSNLTTMPLITSHPIAQLPLLPLSPPPPLKFSCTPLTDTNHSAPSTATSVSTHSTRNSFHTTLHPCTRLPPNPWCTIPSSNTITPGIKAPNICPKHAILCLKPNQCKSLTLSYNFDPLLPILNPLPPKTSPVSPFPMAPHPTNNLPMSGVTPWTPLTLQLPFMYFSKTQTASNLMSTIWNSCSASNNATTKVPPLLDLLKPALTGPSFKTMISYAHL